MDNNDLPRLRGGANYPNARNLIPNARDISDNSDEQAAQKQSVDPQGTQVGSVRYSPLAYGAEAVPLKTGSNCKLNGTALRTESKSSICLVNGHKATAKSSASSMKLLQEQELSGTKSSATLRTPCKPLKYDCTEFKPRSLTQLEGFSANGTHDKGICNWRSGNDFKNEKNQAKPKHEEVIDNRLAKSWRSAASDEVNQIPRRRSIRTQPSNSCQNVAMNGDIASVSHRSYNAPALNDAAESLGNINYAQHLRNRAPQPVAPSMMRELVHNRSFSAQMSALSIPEQPLATPLSFRFYVQPTIVNLSGHWEDADNNHPFISTTNVATNLVNMAMTEDMPITPAAPPLRDDLPLAVAEILANIPNLIRPVYRKACTQQYTTYFCTAGSVLILLKVPNVPKITNVAPQMAYVEAMPAAQEMPNMSLPMHMPSMRGQRPVRRCPPMQTTMPILYTPTDLTGTRFARTPIFGHTTYYNSPALPIENYNARYENANAMQHAASNAEYMPQPVNYSLFEPTQFTPHWPYTYCPNTPDEEVQAGNPRYNYTSGINGVTYYNQPNIQADSQNKSNDAKKNWVNKP